MTTMNTAHIHAAAVIRDRDIFHPAARLTAVGSS